MVEAFEISKTTYMNLLSNLPGVFYRCHNDSSRTMIYLSEHCEELTTYQPAELLFNKAISFQELIHSDDRKWVSEEFNNAIGDKRLFKGEYRIVCRRGIIRWIREIANGIYNEEGIFEFVEGYMEDSTAEREMPVLSRSFSSYKNAVNTGSLVSITDINGNITFANDLFCHYSQYSVNELMGKNHRIVSSGFHSREFFTELWQTIGLGKIWRGEIKNKARDGSYYWVDTVISPIFNEKNEITEFLSIRNIITDKKEAEEKMRVREERYRSLFERNLAGVYRASLDNVILECNDAFATILGFNSAKEIIGKQVRELYTNLSYSDFVAEVQDNNGKITGYESQIITANGQKIYLLENASLIKNESGEVELMEGTLIDITLKKEAEKSLVKSQQRYKNLLHNINDGFMVDDVNGKVTFANGRYCEIFGLKKSDLEDLVLEDYIAPEYRQVLRDRHDRRIKGEEVPDTFEYEGLRKDGERIWVEVRVNPIIEYGETKGTQSIIRDITEKKSKEFEYKKLAELNRKIIDSSDELFYVIEIRDIHSFENPLIYVSNKVEEMYGLTEEELMNSPAAWFAAIHPDDVELVIESTKILFDLKQPVSRIYRNKHHATGEYIWLYDFVKPIMDEHGAIKELFGSIKNISELKNKEAELKKTANELNNRYNELMQFNYIVSHNLRSPIANIIGLSNALDIQAIGSEERPNIIKHIKASTLKMDNLINDLNMILTTRSALNTRKITVSIPMLLLSISDTLEKQVLESGTIINTDISEDAEEIFTIKSYMESIIYNLISNAIKYKSPDRTPQISVSAKKEAGNFILKVADNGIGIDMDKHSKYLFGLYKRFNVETEGKGLGLHMTKAQIETLGGTITVESEPGKGSVFTVTLPVQ